MFDAQSFGDGFATAGVLPTSGAVLSFFSVKRRGMLCETCGKKTEDAWHIEKSTVYTMQFVCSVTIAKLYTFQVSDVVLKELQKILRSYMGNYVNHEFKSLKIIEEMEFF